MANSSAFESLICLLIGFIELGCKFVGGDLLCLFAYSLHLVYHALKNLLLVDSFGLLIDLHKFRTNHLSWKLLNQTFNLLLGKLILQRSI